MLKKTLALTLLNSHKKNYGQSLNTYTLSIFQVHKHFHPMSNNIKNMLILSDLFFGFSPISILFQCKKWQNENFILLISNYQICNYSNTMAQVNHSWNRKLRVPPSTQPLHVSPMRKDTHPPVIIVATHASSCQVCDQS